MKLYLSSYKLGNQTLKLRKLSNSVKNKKVAYISNALDFSLDLKRRKESEQTDMDDLKREGLKVYKIDLRRYFNKKEKLKKEILKYGIIWVRGGNAFVLNRAIKLSGFDKILIGLKKEDDILYGAYSAGVCVLSPSLKGIDLVDDPHINPYNKEVNNLYQGLSLINFSFIPHLKSNHKESNQMDKVLDYMQKNKFMFKALKDGEVIIIDTISTSNRN